MVPRPSPKRAVNAVASESLISTPYWWEAGRPMPAFAAEPPPHSELTIIGGGFTGTSAALTAAQKGVGVTVLDAGLPGQGASTRNGGMIGAPHRPGFVKELRTYGDALAGELVREGLQAYRYTRELYTASDMETGFQETGRIQFANTRAAFEAMKKRLALLNAIQDQGIRVIEREELAAHTSSTIYFGALLYPDHGGVHPRMAHDSLLARAIAAGATFCANTPVTGIEASASGFRLRLGDREITTDRLIIATNGYTSPFGRFIARRIFPVPSFIIATESLPDGVIDRVAPGRHMMVESRARHSYYRPSPDGKRILFGGRAALTPISPELAARRLHQTMAQIWPEAADWRITHSWQGFTGFTFGMIPHVGVRENIHFALGYCGNGVAMSPWLGHKVALRALGDPAGDTAFARTRFDARPYHLGGAPWFMRLASPWWRFVIDTLETRQAARDLRS